MQRRLTKPSAQNMSWRHETKMKQLRASLPFIPTSLSSAAQQPPDVTCQLYPHFRAATNRLWMLTSRQSDLQDESFTNAQRGEMIDMDSRAKVQFHSSYYWVPIMNTGTIYIHVSSGRDKAIPLPQWPQLPPSPFHKLGACTWTSRHCIISSDPRIYRLISNYFLVVQTGMILLRCSLNDEFAQTLGRSGCVWAYNHDWPRDWLNLAEEMDKCHCSLCRE